MKSLTEKIAGMNDKDICATLSALFRRIEAGEPVSFAPDEILLDDHFNVRIRASREAENWIWKAPEVIRAALADVEIKPNPAQAWFSMGMLAYWMYYRTDYYVRNGVSALDAALGGLSRPCVIPEQDADRIPFSAAVSALTAWEPQSRARGVAEFQAYCAARSYAPRPSDPVRTYAEAAPETVSNAEPRPSDPVRTYAEKAVPERWLYLSKACLTGQERDCDSEIKVLKLDSQDAETTLRLKPTYFRPFRAYQITPGAPPRCLGSFSIPASFSSRDTYTVSLRYRASERCLYIDLSAYGKSVRKCRVALGEIL